MYFSWLLTLPPVRLPVDCRSSLSSQSLPLNRWDLHVFMTSLLSLHLAVLAVTLNTIPLAKPTHTHAHTHTHSHLCFFFSLSGLWGLAETQSRQLCQPVSCPRGATWEGGPQTKSQAQGMWWCEFVSMCVCKWGNSFSPHITWTEHWCICFMGSCQGIFQRPNCVCKCVFICVCIECSLAFSGNNNICYVIYWESEIAARISDGGSVTASAVLWESKYLWLLADLEWFFKGEKVSLVNSIAKLFSPNANMMSDMIP